MVDLEKFGEHVKEERKRLNLTQDELSTMLGGGNRSRITAWERKTLKEFPSVEVLDALAEIFSCDIDYLVGKQSLPTKANTDTTAASRLDARAVDVLINGARGTSGSTLSLSKPDFDRLFRKGLNSIIADCPGIAVLVAAYVFGSGADLYALERITIDGNEIPFSLADIALRGGLAQELQRQLEEYRWTVADNGGVAPLNGVEKANADMAARQAAYDVLNPHKNGGAAMLGAGQYKKGGATNGNEK